MQALSEQWREALEELGLWWAPLLPTSGTVAGGKDYAGEPRHVVIMQDDSFDATDSITICSFTTD